MDIVNHILTNVQNRILKPRKFFFAPPPPQSQIRSYGLGVGCAAIINNISIKQRLPSNASIFTAEMKAIDLALDAIAESEDDHFIIFSDSLSVLLSLQNKKMDNPLVVNLLYNK